MDAMTPEELLDHASFVRGLARGLVGDSTRADDLAQSAWVDAFERPPRRGAGSVRSWLATVLRNRHRGERTARVRRERREAIRARPEGLPSTIDLVERRELIERLLSHVTALDEIYQEAILLRYYEGLPPREIATRLGLGVATVKTRLKRALAELRRALDADSPEGREGWATPLAAVAGLDPLLPRAAPTRPQPGEGPFAAAGIGRTVGLVATGLVVTVATWTIVDRLARDDGHATERDGRSENRPADALAGRSPASDRDSRAGSERPIASPRTPDGPRAAPTAATSRERAAVDFPHPAGASGPSLVTGRVVDREGRPVAGARIVALSTSATRCVTPEALARRTSATTSADGRFELDVHAICPSLDVLAEAPDGAIGIARTVLPGDSIRIGVRPAMAFVGRVVDEHARPIADAALRFETALGAIRLVARSRTGERGAFRMTGSAVSAWRAADSGRPLGPWIRGPVGPRSRLSIRAKGFAPLSIEPRPEGIEADAVRLEVELARGTLRRFVVVDADTDRAVADATIALVAPREEGPVRRGHWTIEPPRGLAPTAVATSDGAGRASIRGPVEAGWTVRVDAPGYASTEIAWPATPTDAEPTRVVALAPAAVIEGVVRFSHGAPVRGARVSTRDGDAVTTDAAGRFRLSDVPASRLESVRVRVTARFDGTPTTPALPAAAIEITAPRAAVAAGEPVSADLVLRNPPRARVCVTDANGEPLRGAEVVPIATDGSETSTFVPVAPVGRTGEDGCTTLGFPDREITELGLVRARIKARDHAIAVSEPFAPDPSHPPTVTVALEPMWTIAGTVVDRNGRGVPSIEVILTSERDGAVAVRAFTNASGGFEALGIADGTWHVEARGAAPGNAGGGGGGEGEDGGGVPTGVLPAAAIASVRGVPAGLREVRLVLDAPRSPDPGRR